MQKKLVKLATAENLNCAELNVTECKVQFFKLLNASYAHPAEFFIGIKIEAWNYLVAKLPENDKHREPINEHISYLKSVVESIKEDPPNLEVLKNMADDPNFEGIDIDEASEKRYWDLLKKFDGPKKEHLLFLVQILIPDFAKSFLIPYFQLDQYNMGPFKEELASLYKVYSDLAAALIAENMEASLEYYSAAVVEELFNDLLDMIKSCKIYVCSNGMLGLHLTRAPWDPYPWISSIQTDSSAAQAGMRTGDTVLEINDSDVLGQRIIDIAARVRQHFKSGGTFITMVIWRNKSEEAEETGDPTSNDKAKAHINQHSLQKFATCLQHISQLLECPVCLEITRPPSWQCCNGHVLCNNCRSRTVKCPVCRVSLGPRGRCLLADKLFQALAESFPNESGRKNCKLLTEKQKSISEFRENLTKTTNAFEMLPRALETKEHPKKNQEAEFVQKLKSKRHGIKTTNEPQSQVQIMASNSNSCGREYSSRVGELDNTKI